MIVDKLQYCNRCIMPETTEGIGFDENGICRACVSSEQKMHIDWEERWQQLTNIIEDVRSKAKEMGSAYDCIVPISGGKDSVFQLHILVKVFKLKVLAVTFSHNWYSKIGYYNLVNCLEEFSVDHMQFTPNRKMVGLAARKSLPAIGDACWHCHSGVGAFPLHIAVKFKIPLMVWGESIAEMSGRASHFDPVIKFDTEYFIKVSAKRSVKEFAQGPEEYRMFQMLEPPAEEDYKGADIHGIHLGDFIFWDEERQVDFIKKEYGWLEDDVEGAYKGYKSVECVMPGVHDFTNYLKRGFGRSTVQASMDIRQGLLTRDDAFEIAKQKDSLEPNVLEYYLDITGYTKEEFYEIIQSLRMPAIGGSEVPVVEQRDKMKSKILPFVIEFIRDMRNEFKK